MTADLLVRKSAVISECGKYRYRLERRWGDGPLLPFVMLNPSTADAENDDRTIRRCMAFARREGFSGIIVANLHAYRSKHPSVLAVTPDPTGPDNDDWLRNLARGAFADGVGVVCAWGVWHGPGVDRSLIIIRSSGALTVCLGRTKDNFPRHPLYVKSDQPLEPYDGPAPRSPRGWTTPAKEVSP
jgi:hypothetical protein